VHLTIACLIITGKKATVAMRHSMIVIAYQVLNKRSLTINWKMTILIN